MVIFDNAWGRSVTIRIAGLRGFSISISVSMFYYLYTFFLGLDSWHMEVPRLGVELELQLPASTTATAMLYLSCVFDLHHSSRQHRILNPLSRAGDRTHVLMDTSWVHSRWATTGTPPNGFLIEQWHHPRQNLLVKDKCSEFNLCCVLWSLLK